jgi:hypothetical protein
MAAENQNRVDLKFPNLNSYAVAAMTEMTATIIARDPFASVAIESSHCKLFGGDERRKKDDSQKKLRCFALDRQIVSYLIFLIPNRRNFPFHHNCRPILAIVYRFAEKQLAFGQVPVQPVDDLRIRVRAL